MEIKSKKVLVIGGANVDIGGVPAEGLRLYDSNPGVIGISAGGVGRNIAHNLSLLGTDVSFITAFGGDFFADYLKNNLRGLGIDYSMSVRADGIRSSTYLYITDGMGDMHAAVSDMDAVKSITPAHIGQYKSAFHKFDAVVIDANLTEDTIAYIAGLCIENNIPLYADPVSTAKAGKLKNVLDRVYCIKPNKIEAELLTGKSDPAEALTALHASGVRYPFISLGSDGILCLKIGTEGTAGTVCDSDLQILHIPAVPADTVDATGAGDAAMAALVYAGVCGMSGEESAKLAAKAGAVSVSCVGANNPNLGSILT